MKIVLILLLFYTALSVQAQVVTYDAELGQYVSYDASTGVSTPVSGTPTLTNRQINSYWLVNVNPFAQKISINSTMYGLITPIPEQLATLFAIKTEAQKNLANTDEQVKEMNDVKKEVISSGAPASTSLVTALNQLVLDCSDYYEAAHEINNALFYEERALKLSHDVTRNTLQKMKQALTSQGIDIALLDSLQHDFQLFDQAYHKAQRQYLLTISEAQKANDKDKEARIRNALAQIQKDYLTLEKKYKETLADLKQLFADLTNPASFVVKSQPVKLDGNGEEADEVVYTIKADNFSRVDTFPVEGGIKIDYSVGAVFHSIANDKYFLNSESKLSKQADEARDYFIPTVATMLHIHKRQADGGTWGGMFGINANVKDISDIRLGFLVGLSALLGRSQKFIVSSGLSFTQTDRLQGPYTEGTSYKDVKDFNIDNVTKPVLWPSWFIAFSFNISKRTPFQPIP